MKILYMDHPEADYLAAQLYEGLVQLLGIDSVVDYPVKRTYHGEVHTYPHVYDTDPGSNAWSTWKMTDGGPVGTTSPFEWMPPHIAREWSCDEVVKALLDKEFDLTILASPRKYNVAALKELIERVGRHHLPRLVMVDGEDYTAVRWDLIDELKPAVYFKREMVPNPDDVWPNQRAANQPHVPVKPLPLAAVRLTDRIGAEPYIDVSLLGGTNVPGGKEPFEKAVRDATSNYVLGQIPYREYMRLTARSRIAVAVRGHSPDSFRSWEMLGVDGPLVAVQRHNLIRPQPFIDGEHVAEFGTPEELTALLKKYLADEPLRAKIALQGHNHLKAFHTVKERARYLLQQAGVL